MNIRPYLYLLTTMLFWSGTFISGKVISGSVHPVVSALLRFTFATLVLLVPLFIQRKKVSIPSSKDLFLLVILAITGPVGFNLFFFKGLQYIEAGRASLIVAFNPMMIMIAVAIFFHEKLRWPQYSGIILALIGTLFVLASGDWHRLFSGGVGKGELAILGAISSWTVYSLVGKKLMEKFTPLHMVLCSSLIGSLLLFALVMIYGLESTFTEISVTNWLNLIFLGSFGTAAGVTLYYSAIKEIGAARAGVFINFVPFFAVLLSWLILGEPITQTAIVGGILLTSGVFMAGKAS